MGRGLLGSLINGMVRASSNASRQAVSERKRELLERKSELTLEIKNKKSVANSAQRVAEAIKQSISDARSSQNPKTKLARLDKARQKTHELRNMLSGHSFLKFEGTSPAEMEAIIDRLYIEAEEALNQLRLKEEARREREWLEREQNKERQRKHQLAVKQAEKEKKDQEKQKLSQVKILEYQKVIEARNQKAQVKMWERQRIGEARNQKVAQLKMEKERIKLEICSQNSPVTSKDEKNSLLQEKVNEIQNKNSYLVRYLNRLSSILNDALNTWRPIPISALIFQKYKSVDKESIVAYYMSILECSEYPKTFPRKIKIAYNVESKELVIDYELPPLSIVPTAKEYRYVKSRDLTEEKLYKSFEINELYQDVVASVALRTIYEVFKADSFESLDAAVFSGYVNAVDPATGKDIRPYLISTRAVKSTFMEFDLSRVDKRTCLRNLGAQLSPQPSAMQPVKPIVYFDMIDKRFVEYGDALAGLDTKPNLMELNPWEFETLVSNLFSKMGLETKLTRSSKDGGVDAIAFDVRPILGGKIVIQAKRYKNTVGVSAVRDLYGTMLNEGANKGILVTTSGYGPDAFTFAKDKPIELMNGGQLLYMLDQVGIQAKIIMPEEWNSE